MKQKIRLTENQLHQIIKESVNKILMESDNYDDYTYGVYDRSLESPTDYEYDPKVYKDLKPYNESYDDLEDMPEYRPQGNRYYKYRVEGYRYFPPVYNNGKTTREAYVDYPYAYFDNIEDARKCAEVFRQIDNAVPQNVKIKGFYKTLEDNNWEYIK